MNPEETTDTRPPRTPSGKRSPLERPLRRLAIALAIGGGLGAGGYFARPLFFPPAASDGTINGELVHRVARGDLVIAFTERGNIKAARSVPIFCQLEGQSTIVSVVPEGSSVKAGDLLVELDSSSLTQQLNQQQITVESAEADLKNAREQVILQESLNKSTLQTAELDLELARIDLRKYVEGDFILAMKKAEGEISIAAEELTRAQNKLEWTQKLAARGYVTRLELQADEIAVNKAKVQHEQALGSRNLLRDFTHQKELRTYETKLEQAKDALDRARRKAVSELAQAQASEKAKEATFNLSVRRLEKLKDQVGKTKIFAPQDGMVVYETPQSRGGGRERVVEQGSDVRENQLLMNLPDVSTMAVSVQVHESWVDQVRPGLLALVSIDSLPHLNKTGRVTKVGLLPDYVNRWLNPDLKVYQTEITIDPDQDTQLLRPGMSAKVQIIIDKLRGIIAVPVQSVTTVDKQHVCYVLEGGKFRPQPVQTGRYNDAYIEIRSGLKDGDVIQLNAPSPQGGSSIQELDLEGYDLSRSLGPPSGVGGLPDELPARFDREPSPRGPEAGGERPRGGRPELGGGPPAAEGRRAWRGEGGERPAGAGEGPPGDGRRRRREAGLEVPAAATPAAAPGTGAGAGTGAAP